MTRYSDLSTLLRNISPDVHIVGDPPDPPLTSRLVEGRDQQQMHVVSQSIVLPLPVSANRYWRNYGGRVVVSDAAKTYKQAVILQAECAGLRPFACAVAVYLHVYRARKVGDLDNMNKVLLDALRGIAYNDDAQIVELHAYRHDDKTNPRVEVEVRKVEAQP